MKRIITIAAFLILGFSSSFAQPMKWKKLADGILTPARNNVGLPAEYGSIEVKDNIIVAGWGNLVISTDFGNSWTKLIHPKFQFVCDIAMYDQSRFAIGTSDNVLYTSDQGKTWSVLGPNNAQAVIFDNSSNRVISISNSRVIILENATETIIPLNYNVSDLQRGLDNALYILAGRSEETVIFYSTDNGYSWQIFSQIPHPDWDCYSMICDKSDPNHFLVVNEDWAINTNQFSEIFISSDAGKSWTTTLQKPIGNYTYLLGNSTQGCNDYFVGSSIDGILRSSDKGISWNSIGGPATPVDSRTIFAVDDSIIYAIDTLGSIWVTDATRSSGLINESIADIYIDTLGGDVAVPIDFKSSVDINAEFSLHFDTSDLLYKGTFDSYNIDHSIWVDKGTARIRYNPAQDSVLYARFSFFPTDSNCTKVTIDSLITVDNSPGCVVSRTLTAIICGPEGCGINQLSRFIRYGTTPTFSITPNPTRGTITLQSNIDIDGAAIEIRNEVGAISYSTRSDINKSDGLSLDVSSLPSGVYILLVKGHGAGVPLVIMK